MRSQAKPPSAGSTTPWRSAIATLLALVLLGAAPALGAPIHKFSFSFGPAGAGNGGSCPNEEIRQQQESTHLPECMAYELISPADTNGVDVSTGYAADDGDHAWISAQIPISAEQSSGNVVNLAATRTQSGWQLRDLGTPGAGANNRFVMEAYSPDGSGVVLNVCENLLLGCRPGPFSIERVDGSGARTTMLETTLGEGFPQVADIVGHSDDLSRVFIRQFAENIVAPFIPEDTHTAGAGLYEAHDGTLTYIGRDEDGNVLPCGAVLGDNEIQHNNGNGNGFQQSGASADGRTVVFESPDPGVAGEVGCEEPVGVYVRHDGASVDISRPRNGNPDEGARFVGVSRDGDTTYFTTRSQILLEDTDANNAIYSYDRTANTYQRVSADLDVFPGYASVSPNGAYVYFASSQSFEGQGIDGNLNLYAYHAGSLRFVATGPLGSFGLGGSIRSDRPTFITPDGSHLLFSSSDPLGSGQPTGGLPQILQYSYGEDTMTCVSCPPDGSVPTHQIFPSALNPAGNVDGRPQSDDGNSVAFEAEEALLPGDINKVSDVYLWRRNAPLALISSGHSETASTFAQMSADGHNVLFQADDRLTPDAKQDNTKLYDARVNGGFAPTPTPTPCAGEACRGAGTVAPGNASTASNTFSGPGNPKHRRRHKRPHKKKSKTHKTQHAKRLHGQAAKNNRGAVR